MLKIDFFCYYNITTLTGVYTNKKEICVVNDYLGRTLCFPVNEIKTVSHDMADTSDRAYIEINGVKMYLHSHYQVDKGHSGIKSYLSNHSTDANKV